MSRNRRRGGRVSGRPIVVEGEVGGQAQQPPRIVVTDRTIDLGDLSETAPARGAVDATFAYFGHRYRVNPDLSEIDAMDFMDRAENVDPNDPSAVTLVKRWAQSTIHPGDFDAFWTAVKANRQDSTNVMSLMWAILGGITDLPTTPPSDSSDGRLNTNLNSQAGSSGPAAPQPAPAGPNPASLYEPSPTADGAEAYLKQIDRFQARGDGFGVAMAAQIATMAEARGIDVTRTPLDGRTG